MAMIANMQAGEFYRDSRDKRPGINIIHMKRNLRSLHLDLVFWVLQPIISDPIKENLILFILIHSRNQTHHFHCILNWIIVHNMQKSALVNAHSLKIIACCGCKETSNIFHKDLRANEPKGYLCMVLSVYYSINSTVKSFSGLLDVICISSSFTLVKGA